VHVRRESENEPLASIETPVAMEGKKREAEAIIEEESEKVVKKRRVAPVKVDE
jgi:hypothetical protein